MKILGLLGLGLVSFVLNQAFPTSTNSRVTFAGDSKLTKASVDPLLENVQLFPTDKTTLQLEPGVRARVSSGEYTLTTYDGSKVQLRSGDFTTMVPSPAVARIGVHGWEVNGLALNGSALTALRLTQDDTDSNLKSMQDSAKKLKSKNNANQDASQQPGKKLRFRFLYGENPNPTAELFNKAAIQQLTHLSPVGF